MNEILAVRGLNVSFLGAGGQFAPVLEDLSLSIEAGKTLALVGESGSGKSVTALSIMRLLDAATCRVSGEILLDGKNLLTLCENELNRDIRGSRAAMIFQEPMTSLHPLHRVGEQIIEALRAHRELSAKEARIEAIRLLERVRIPSAAQRMDDFVQAFSGGMRQRVMIAMALSCEPKLLIADEPTTALDVTIQAQILQLMRGLRDEFQTAIVLITHDLGVVAEMADRVIVMYAGQVVEQADVYSLFKSPKHPYTRGLMNSTPKIHELRDSLESIRGMVPTPAQMPAGCRFAPRCPQAAAQCATAATLRDLSDGSQVRCWLHEEGAS